MNKTIITIIELTVYLSIIILIGGLVYEQAFYEGMKQLCPNGNIYEDEEIEGYTCLITFDETEGMGGINFYGEYNYQTWLEPVKQCKQPIMGIHNRSKHSHKPLILPRNNTITINYTYMAIHKPNTRHW